MNDGLPSQVAVYPESVGRRAGTIGPDGTPTTASVVKQDGGYYQWIQGTSMASPHAVGVAALIVAQYGKKDEAKGGVTLAPERVEQTLRSTATDTACPTPRTVVYNNPAA